MLIFFICTVKINAFWNNWAQVASDAENYKHKLQGLGVKDKQEREKMARLAEI